MGLFSEKKIRQLYLFQLVFKLKIKKQVTCFCHLKLIPVIISAQLPHKENKVPPQSQARISWWINWEENEQLLPQRFHLEWGINTWEHLRERKEKKKTDGSYRITHGQALITLLKIRPLGMLFGSNFPFSFYFKVCL